MSAEDRVRWDSIYKQRSQEPYPDPDPLLLQYIPPADLEDRLTALDLAGGLGQNALWLASQGYIVDLMDVSRIALQRARAEMAIRNLRNVNLLQIDVDDIQLDENNYDLVIVTRYLKRDLFERIQASVKPGGRVIYDTFNVRYLEQVPAFNPAFLLEIGELRNYFATWTILSEDEEDHNSRIVAVKP
jgi:tellurite methyltransferase